MASFRKLQSGEWGVGLDSTETAGAVAGQVLVIERKDRTEGRAVLGAIVTGGAWGSIWTIAPKPAATPPAAPAAPAAPPTPAATPAVLPKLEIKVPPMAAPKRSRKNKEI
jgi:hypothetical protein